MAAEELTSNKSLIANSIESKRLSDGELNLKIKSLAAEERKLTKEILLHIAEVDKRRLFLRMAYASLFDYLTKEIGYSAGAAHRRIDAARLIQKLPDVSSKIEEGKINLSQISKIQQVFRQIKKDTGQQIETSTQKVLLEKVESKTAQQTDLILTQEFNIEIKNKDRVSIQKNESVRLEITFSKAEMEMLQKAQAILSHKTGGSLKETILEMAEETLKQSQALKPSQRLQTHQKLKNRQTSKTQVTSTVEVTPTKKISKRMKSEILNKDQFCQFKDIKTGRICGSKFFLEIDHIQPLCQGGENNPKNLRVLCRNHNQFRYRQMLD